MMRRALLLLPLLGSLAAPAAKPPVHVWEKYEITLQARNSYKNPYLDALVWVDLKGPNFQERVYGFWDGGATFRVRVMATGPGDWSWTSGSAPEDPGLSGVKGEFQAVAWTAAEKAENVVRRGLLRPTANGHAFEHADGTPFFLLGDTWWSAPTFRFRWTEDDTPHRMGPEATFKDMVRFRKAQGFNSIAMLAAWPNWANDGKPANLTANDEDKTLLRSAWADPKTGSAKDQHNEGGRPFLFPGRVPGYEDVFGDVDRVNPGYFQYLDKKIDYLNSQGFIPFIELTRRDAGPAWKKYYQWPDSYSRFIQYVFSRYQANNVLLSPIHLDWYRDTFKPHTLYSEAADLVIRKYGPPPFGTLVSTNANPSTLVDWGTPSWLTFHQTGNERTHDIYWYMTELWRSKPAMPALAGEPYYPGYQYKPGETVPYYAEGGTERDSLYNRSSMYGNFLSGGFGGYIQGSDGIWQANIEPEARVKMWDAFGWESGAQVKYLRTFAFSNGTRFQELEPDADLVYPNKTYEWKGYEGWAFGARTPRRDFFLIYLEKGLPRQVTVRGTVPDAAYDAQWFNPRNGEWTPAGSGVLTSNTAGRIELPPRPSGEDWGLRLLLKQ
jgi:hypothetical protein